MKVKYENIIFNVVNTVLLSIAISYIFPCFSQSKSKGNTFIHGPREATVFGNHNFTYGGNGVMPGIVGTKRNNPTCLAFAGTSSVSGVSDQAHVDGYVKNYKHQNFTFPIGDNGFYGPISIASGSPLVSPISAAYYFANPDVAVTSSIVSGNEPPLPQGAPFSRNQRQTGILSVSSIEYWDVDGTNPAILKLHWTNRSNIAELTNSMIVALRIVGWDGTQWVDIPSSLDAGADLSGGTISTSLPIIPDKYLAYTFGSSCDLVDVTFSGFPAGGLYLCEGEKINLDIDVALSGMPYAAEYALERYDATVWNQVAGYNNDGIFTFTGLPPNVQSIQYRISVKAGTCVRYSDAFTLHSYRGQSISCHSEINSTVNQQCEFLVTPNLFVSNLQFASKFYEVEIKNANGQIVSNPIKNPKNLEKFMVTVHDKCTENKCWGTIILEDKTPPVINNCNQQQTLACFYLDAVKAEKPNDHFNGKFVTSKSPEVTENCGNFKSEFIDIFTDKDCDTKSIVRNWQFTDQAGNKSSCQQVLNFVPLKISDFTDPVAQVVLDCKNAYDPSDIKMLFDDTNTKDSIKSSGIEENYEGAVYAGFTYKALGADGALHAQWLKNHICNISVAYTDEDMTKEGCYKERKIIRKWLLVDNCSNEVKYFNQTIILKDTTAPVFTLSSIKQSLEGQHCVANVIVPPPSDIQDDCTSAANIKWYIIPPVGSKVKGIFPNFVLEGLSKGIHNLIYVVEDCAGNKTQKQTSIHIYDQITPTVIAKHDIVVSLSNNASGKGYAKLMANAVDDGSFDYCSPVRVEIRRKIGNSCENNGAFGQNNNLSFSNNVSSNHNTPPLYTWSHPGNHINDNDGGTYVTFCCDDIQPGLTYGIHEVELRVWDDANGNGIPGDTLIIGGVKDNFNSVWTKVRVEYKIPPLLSCPKDIVLQCDNQFYLNTQVEKLITGTLHTGLPTVKALCTDSFALTYVDRWQSGGLCNTGTVIRTFRLYESAFTCTQKITVNPHPMPFTLSFDEAGTVDWDKCEFTLEDAKNAKLLPKINHSPCAAIGQKIVIDTFYFNGGTCKKWVVKYSYLNHCTGQTIEAPIMTYVYNDTTSPDVALSHSQNDLKQDCTSELILRAKITDQTVCNNMQKIKSDVLIDLENDSSIDYISSYKLQNIVTAGSWSKITSSQPLYNIVKSLYPDKILADELYIAYQALVPGSNTTISLHPLNLVNTGKTNKLYWTAIDECGNSKMALYEFKVEDMLPPALVCMEISTSITSDANASVELWAKDFVTSASDNCTNANELLFTFDRIYPITTHLLQQHYFKQDSTGKSVIATSAEYESGIAQNWNPIYKTSGKKWLHAGIYNIPVIVWDLSGNQNQCTTKVVIINTTEMAPISGRVFTIHDLPKAGAEISFMADMPDYPKSTLSNTDGHYQMQLPKYASYHMKGDYFGPYIEGISTLDLVMIQRHILSLEPFDNVYKVIAADVTNDGKVTAADLVSLRKLVLGLSDSFENKSWRIPLKNQNLLLSNPFPYKEDYQIDSLTDHQQQQDFTAIKIGDINGNSGNGNLKYLEPRISKSLSLVASNNVLIPGEKIIIPITANNFFNIFGLQATLHLKHAVFVDILPEKMKLNESHVGKLSDDLYTLSYSSPIPVSFDKNDILFNLIIESSKAAFLDDVLSMSSEVTPAEYYDKDMKVGKINLNFKDETNRIILLQNEPNPFIQSTTISWVSPKSETVKLLITDEQGKVIISKTIKAVKGINSMPLENKDLPFTGVYYYTITGENLSETKKMVKIE